MLTIGYQKPEPNYVTETLVSGIIGDQAQLGLHKERSTGQQEGCLRRQGRRWAERELGASSFELRG